jgi:hypothetical protein
MYEPCAPEDPGNINNVARVLSGKNRRLVREGIKDLLYSMQLPGAPRQESQHNQVA